MVTEAHTIPFINPKVPYEYKMDGPNKFHFTYPKIHGGALFMFWLTWAMDSNDNTITHFQFVPILCEECFKK